MGTSFRILLVCLLAASGCKIISSSFRGKHGSNASADAKGTVAAGTSGNTENPTIPAEEEVFRIPAPPPETPIDGTVVRRSTGGIQISGNIGGIWDKSVGPVYITGDVTLPTGKTLLIKEGVQVIISPDARFYVEGAQLKIEGTAAEPVLFTSTAADQTWPGIRLCSAAACDTEEVRGKLDIRFAVFERSRKADLDPNDVTWRHGGVFYARSLETLIIEDTIFRNNSSLESGGAIEIIADNPSIIFRRNTLRDNSNDGSGGALQITNGRNLRIEQNTFINNTSKAEGGAIALIDSASIELLSNTFENNSSELPGGAIYCDGHGSTILVDSSNVFKGNLPVDTLCKDE